MIFNVTGGNAGIIGKEAGGHNSAYRGKYLGSAVTDEQWEAIKDGTFNGLYIGDYWTIDGINYRIAAFDYYLNMGDTACTAHHVVIVPDANMYTYAMHTSTDISGAYVGSKMYTAGLAAAKTTITAAFGSGNILNHRQYLPNAATDGYVSAGSWYDSEVELMTEQNVYGSNICGNSANGTQYPRSFTLDNSQFPLFAFRHDLICNGATFWLRDVASATRFCYVNGNGAAYSGNPTNASGVRPAFAIC